MYAYVGEEEFKSGAYNTFFDSFKVIPGAKKVDLTKSRVQEIMALLTSKDSAKAKEAISVMYYHDWDKNDLPYLFDALEQDLLDASYWEDPKDVLVAIIANTGGKKEFDQLMELYNSDRADDALKMNVVQNIMSFKDQNADDALMNLLLKNPPKRNPEMGYYVFYQLEDSLSVMKNQASKLGALYSNKDFKDQLIDLYVGKILSEEDPADYFSDLQQKIIADIPDLIAKYNDTITRNANDYLNANLMSNISYMAEVDPAIPAEPSGEILAMIYRNKEDDNWVPTEALIKAITMGFDISPQILNLYMEDYYSRYEVMEALVGVEMNDLIPSQYIQPEEYANLCAYNTIGSYDDDYSHPITDIGTLEYNNKSYKAYKVSRPDEDGVTQDYLYVAAVEAANLDSLDYVSVFNDLENNPMGTNWEEDAKRIIQEGLEYEGLYD